MKVLSVNVGVPMVVLFNGQTVTMAIFKNPVKAPIKLRKLNLDGDRQADLTVHGGVDKAVYSYPAEHYGAKNFQYGYCVGNVWRELYHSRINGRCS